MRHEMEKGQTTKKEMHTREEEGGGTDRASPRRTKKKRGRRGRREEEEPTEQARRKTGSPCECYVSTSCGNFHQLHELLLTLLLVEHSDVGKTTAYRIRLARAVSLLSWTEMRNVYAQMGRHHVRRGKLRNTIVPTSSIRTWDQSENEWRKSKTSRANCDSM